MPVDSRSPKANRLSRTHGPLTVAVSAFANAGDVGTVAANALDVVPDGSRCYLVLLSGATLAITGWTPATECWLLKRSSTTFQLALTPGGTAAVATADLAVSTAVLVFPDANDDAPVVSNFAGYSTNDIV
jgi:hypothetical protein